MAKKIYIDAGHGGNDSGAIGIDKVLEKDITLSVALKVEALLKQQGFEVRLSRNNDTTRALEYRANDANTWGANAFVSIHCNASNGAGVGIETYCYNFNYRALADDIHKAILAEGVYNRDRGVKEGNFYVLRETKMPAALLELGFIDNTQDITLLLNKQDQFALGIVKGICKYFGVAYVPPAPPTPTEELYYRVVVGSFKDRNLAEECLQKAKDSGFADSFITTYIKQ